MSDKRLGVILCIVDPEPDEVLKAVKVGIELSEETFKRVTGTQILHPGDTPADEHSKSVIRSAFLSTMVKALPEAVRELLS